MKLVFFALGTVLCTCSAAQQPFSYLNSDLPPNYTGANCANIYQATSKLQGTKDKYETTEEYEQRTAKIDGTALTADIKLGDQIAFRVDIAGLGLTLDYNADTQSLIAKQMASITSVPLYNKLANVVTINSKEISSKSSVGSNSFGVKRRMDTAKYVACGIALTNFDYEPHLTLYADGKNIPAGKVRSAENNVAFLIIGTVVAPYHTKASYFAGATLDSPTEVHWDFAVVPVKVDQTVVYNIKTGEVLLRRDFKQ